MAVTPTIANRFPGASSVRPSPYFGFPYRGNPRRVKPTILGVVHITDGYSVPVPGPGKSWTFAVARDGTVHQFLDPVTQAPWTNGDAKNPDTTNPLVAAATSGGRNPNEACLVTIENVGRITGDGQLLTEAQIRANREILRWASKLSGIPMSRTTVVGHYQFNSVDRNRCPTLPADRDRVFGGILAEEEDMAWQADIKHVDPYRALIRQPATYRVAPDLTSPGGVVLPNAEWRTIIGTVKGVDFGAGPDWLVIVSANSGLKVIHSQDVLRTEALSPNPISREELERAMKASRADGIRAAAEAAASVK